MFTNLKYIHFVCLIGGLRLISQCLSTSALPMSHSANDSNINTARKLSNDIELITSDSNRISELNDLLINEQQITNKDFHQYYSEPITPIYEPTYSNHRPNINHTHTYYSSPPLMTTPYVVNKFMPHENRQQHLMKIMKSQSSQWSQGLINSPYAENQYLVGFRNIKTSVMNFIYRVQDIMSYVMSFFTLDNNSLVEGRGKKFKIKKKYKKFLLPLLLAYKLKFFALIPILMGGLILLVGSTGMAGFFFALFTAVISLKDKH